MSKIVSDFAKCLMVRSDGVSPHRTRYRFLIFTEKQNIIIECRLKTDKKRKFASEKLFKIKTKAKKQATFK